MLLRGVYFTSGTQEGTPIIVCSAPSAAASAVRRCGHRRRAGKVYFVEQLLKNVLIGESGLAGVNRRLELRKAASQLGAYAAILITVVGRAARLVGELCPQPRLCRPGCRR